MNRFRAALLALSGLALAFHAHARPVIIEEATRLAPPTDRSWQSLGGFGVAIDGDFALVSAERTVSDTDYDPPVRYEGAALLYQRNGTAWNYVGLLGEIGVLDPEYLVPGLAMKDGIAVTVMGYDFRIFERVNGVWTQTAGGSPTLNNFRGSNIKIDGGRILIARNTCEQNSAVLRKINGVWTVEGELQGQLAHCDATPPHWEQDIDGTRAVVLNEEGPLGEPARIRKYQFTNGSWSEYAPIEAARGELGQDVAIVDNVTLVTGLRQFGTRVYWENWPDVGRYGVQPADAHMDENWYTQSIERAGDLFAQLAYSYDRPANVIHLYRMNSGTVPTPTYLATLRARSGASLGGNFAYSSDGNRLIATSTWTAPGPNVIRIFDLPRTYTTPPVQVYDFEAANSAAAWQPTAGSNFTVTRVGNTYVYRQPSTALSPASWIQGNADRNQSIQAEIWLRAISGTDRWVGLATRRADDSNYYYVALRTSGRVELKKAVNGVFTTLAASDIGISVGSKVRLRLESTGVLHRVYLDDTLVASAIDDSHKRGQAGVIMNRAAADYDNVIVSPSPFTTIYRDSFQDGSMPLPTQWTASGGNWRRYGSYLGQDDDTGYARYLVGARTDDQIVQVNVRPTGYAGPDYWVGLLLRYQDERNHVYVSLHQRGVISLWRRTNGAIQQLATRRVTLRPNFETYYKLRAETVAGVTRVYFDDELQFSVNAALGPNEPPGVLAPAGKVGLITYRATAIYDHFLAYQP